jgi:hypothetical protein
MEQHKVTSAIDPTKPVDGVPAVKADLRANLQSAKDEIEALQGGKADLGHQHVLVDIADAGALAAKDLVELGDVAAGAITGSELAADAVSATKLADAAVTEAKLADGAVTQAKIAADAVGASQLQDGIPIDMQDQQLSRPRLKDFSEARTTPVIGAGVLTLDLEAGNVFEVVLSEDVTSLALLNPPASGSAGSITLILHQDGTGGRTLAWPASVRWPGGAAPSVTGTAGAVDVLSFVTTDGGTTWFGFLGGKDFS